MSQEITPSILPTHLEPRTIGNMPIESPRFVRPGFLYLREQTNELFLHRMDQLGRHADRPTQVLGRVGIMRVAVLDRVSSPEGEYVDGYIADLRHITSGDDFLVAPPVEMPSDQELVEEWLDDTRNMIPIAAIAFRDTYNDNKTTASGDERFIQAVQHLVKLSNEIQRSLSSVQKFKPRPNGKSTTQMRTNRKK